MSKRYEVYTGAKNFLIDEKRRKRKIFDEDERVNFLMSIIKPSILW